MRGADGWQAAKSKVITTPNVVEKRGGGLQKGPVAESVHRPRITMALGIAKEYPHIFILGM